MQKIPAFNVVYFARTSFMIHEQFNPLCSSLKCLIFIIHHTYEHYYMYLVLKYPQNSGAIWYWNKSCSSSTEVLFWKELPPLHTQKQYIWGLVIYTQSSVSGTGVFAVTSTFNYFQQLFRNSLGISMVLPSILVQNQLDWSKVDLTWESLTTVQFGAGHQRTF